jgi:hypothetical protein
LRRWIELGKLIGYKPGGPNGRLMIDLAELEELVAASAVGPKARR